MVRIRTPKKNYGLGWHRELPDPRRLRYERFVTPPAVLPTTCDITNLVSTVKDQGSEGSCVAHGVTSAFEALQIKQQGTAVLGCRNYEYRMARIVGGDFPGDNGSTIADGVTATVKYGVAPETDWPYDPNQMDANPPAKVISDAVKDETNNTYLLDSASGYAATLVNIKTCLAMTGLPVVYGTPVYAQIEEVGSDGIITYPGANEESIGGHCMAFFGYQPGYLWTLNSWGQGWGKAFGKYKGGLGLLPEQYITAGLVRDSRVIAGETEINPTPIPPTPVPPTPTPPTPTPTTTCEKKLKQILNIVTSK